MAKAEEQKQNIRRAVLAAVLSASGSARSSRSLRAAGMDAGRNPRIARIWNSHSCSGNHCFALETTFMLQLAS